VVESDFFSVDWAKIPAPEDDGAARHLDGMALPRLALPATDGTSIDLSGLAGRSVLYAYPLTGRPGVPLPAGWDEIPGARGCTPQSCGFRDHLADLIAAGASHVFGLSTQTRDYQREAVERLHLPFPLLSDSSLAFARTLRLPVMQVEGKTLLRRMALIIDDGITTKAFYPVFPPDRNAADVLEWLKANPR
jgi:peroxiredoxin